MSTLQVKGGSGPSGQTLKKLNNRNNLVTLHLKKQLDQLKREHSFSISVLDRDKFETHDFLQRINRKDSDKHPASIKYLKKPETNQEFGDFDKSPTPRKPTRQKRRRPKQKEEKTPYTFDKIDDDDEEITPRESQCKTEMYLERQRTFSIQPQTSLTTLPALERRESVYFQIASVNPGDLSSDSSDEEKNEPSLQVKTKDLSTRRRSSFVAWVKENSVDKKEKLLERLKMVQMKNDPLEQRRISFAHFIERYKKQDSVSPSMKLQDIGESSSPAQQEISDANNDIMKSILQSKTERPHKISGPLNDRIDTFYNRINHLKTPVFRFDSSGQKMTALERRRYTLLTKGLKTALADSDDEDE